MTEEKMAQPIQPTEEQNKEQKKLKEKELKIQSKAFFITLESLFTFIIPAGIVVFLNYNFEFSRVVLYFLLLVAFVFSWVIVMIRVRSIGEELKKIRSKREELGLVSTKPSLDYDDDKEFED